MRRSLRNDDDISDRYWPEAASRFTQYTAIWMTALRESGHFTQLLKQPCTGTANTPLADEDFADQVWEAWDSGEINDRTALLLWTQVALATGGFCTWIYRIFGVG